MRGKGRRTIADWKTCRVRHIYLAGVSMLSALCLGISVVGAQTTPSLTPLSLDEYLALFEDPQRDHWQQPDAVIHALTLQPGQIVADIGAGSGYFTLRLARAVAPKGRVFALEFAEGTLDYLGQRLTREGINNVQALLVPHHDPLLVDGSLDMAFLCNVYHHLEDRAAYLRKVRKGLKPKGRVVIVDFYQREGMPVGPPMGMRLSEDTVEKELAAAGFSVSEKLTFLPYQYLVIARPMTAASAPSPTKGE